MGYNGPPPGLHVIEGVPVLTVIVDSKKKIPQLGDSYPNDPRWVADKPTRIECIRICPNLWSVDVPYVWALNWNPPRTTTRRYTLAPRLPWWRLAVLVGVLVALAGAKAWGEGTTQPAKVKFVGCYKQRARDLKAWADRGINLAVLWEPENGTVSQSAWRKAARDAGLVYIDVYMDDGDADDPNLLGWSLTNSDEWNRARGPQSTRQPTAPLIAEAEKLAALNKAKGTNKLIFANADGPSVTTAMFEKPPYNGVKNNEKALLPYLTLRSVDWYPVVSIPSTQPSEIARRPMYLPAQAAWRLRTWSDEIGAQPAQYMVIVEAAKGWKSPLGVTGDQMRETVDYVMGNRPFPVPDANGKPVMFQGRVADIVVFWTANGQDGPGWVWFACNGDQEAAIIGITAAIKDVVVDPVKALQATIVVLQKNLDMQAAQIEALTANNIAINKAQQAIIDDNNALRAQLQDPATARELLLRALTPATTQPSGGAK